MSNNTKGLRIGNYRITPLGLVTLAVLLVLIAGGIVLAVLQPFGGADKPVTTASAKATAAPASAASAPFFFLGSSVMFIFVIMVMMMINNARAKNTTQMPRRELMR